MSDDDKRKQDFEDDYEFSRETYRNILQKFEDNFELVEQLIQNSEHPRAIEVFTQMLKGASDVNDKLMELHKKDKEYRVGKGAEALPSPDSENNTYFVGSARELQEFLHGKKEEPKVINGTSDRNSNEES